jgi:hypothetical protein
MTLTIPTANYGSSIELLKRLDKQKVLEEDFINPVVLNTLNLGAGATEISASATSVFPHLIGGRIAVLSTTINSQWSRTAGNSRIIVPGKWQMNIVGRFAYEPGNATPLATHVNNTTLFMGLHFSRYTSLAHSAAIGFHYNDSGAGIFIANNSVSSIVLPTTPLLLPARTMHTFQIIVQQNTPQVDLYVNDTFVVSTVSPNIPQYNNVSRAMIPSCDVIKTVADTVNLPVRYTLDGYALLLEQI